MDELIGLFSLDRVSKAGARFDPEKAKWFNHQYLVRKSNEELAGLFSSFMNFLGMEVSWEKALRIVDIMKVRVNFVHEMWEKAEFFFLRPESYDEASVRKFWKEDVPAIMKEVVGVLGELEVKEFVSAKIEESLENFIREKGYGMGKVMNAVRLCLIGVSNGPAVADVCEVIGREESIVRIERAVEVLGNFEI